MKHYQEAGTSNAEKKPHTLGKTHYKDVWLRICGVLAVASTISWDTREVDYNQAAVNFRKAVGKTAASSVHEAHTVFCRRHYSNFMDDGTVEDRHRSGRPAEISEADAKEAGALLMQGFWREVKVKGKHSRTEQRLFYYTTVADAVDRCAELRSIMEKYQCSDRLMLAAIHRHCPELRRVTLVSHHEFTMEELQARMNYGTYMLNLMKKEPNILFLIVFCDESTFAIHGRTDFSVKVYCSTECVPGPNVCNNSDLALKPLKVHFFLAVTANQAFQPDGVVLYEECTGTDGINRHENRIMDGSERVGNWEYTKKGKCDPAFSTTEEEMTDLLALTCKKFHDKTGSWPYLNYDNNKIQKNIGIDPDDPDVYRLSSNHGDDIVMPRDRKLPQPTHSPDCNRPVEHAFGSGKTRVRNNLYMDNKRVTSGAQLRPCVKKQFTSGGMPALAVREDVLQLPLLYEIISTPAGVVWEDEEGKVHVGTGGDWGPPPTM